MHPQFQDLEHNEIIFNSDGFPHRVICSDSEQDEWFLTQHRSWDKEEVAATEVLTKKDLLLFINSRGFFS